MQRALDLARRGEGRTGPNPPVGAILVKDGQIVGEGFHPRAGDPHAEIFALRHAGGAARGSDLYVTLEPCSHRGRTGPCAEALLDAGIRRAFIGTQDPNPLVQGRGMSLLRKGEIPVESGLLEAECRRLIAPFAKHVTTGLPYVILKSAVTLDGHTATSAGDSQWISGDDSRTLVHRLRDRVDAIMVGIGTVLHDDPRLTTRLPEGGKDPLRVVVDGRLEIPEEALVLRGDSAASTLVATTARASRDKVERLRALGAEVLLLGEDEGRVDLSELMGCLGQRGIQSLLLEGGGRLNAAAIREGLVDRMMVFVAPLLLGGNDGQGIFSGCGVRRLADALRLDDVRITSVGVDTLIEGEVKGCSPV